MGSKRAAAVAPVKHKRRKVFALRDFPKGCGWPGKQLSNLSGPKEARLGEGKPNLVPVEPPKHHIVDRSKVLGCVEKKEKAGFLKVSAHRAFRRGLGEPDEELPEFSEPEKETLALEENDSFLDRIEPSERDKMVRERESEDVLKGSRDGLGFYDASVAKWRWASAVRDFPIGCGTNPSKPRPKKAVAKKPLVQKPVGCLPSEEIESEMKRNNDRQMQSRVQETCKETGVNSPLKRSSIERKVVAGSNSERRSEAQQTMLSDTNSKSPSGSKVVRKGNGPSAGRTEVRGSVKLQKDCDNPRRKSPEKPNHGRLANRKRTLGDKSKEALGGGLIVQCLMAAQNCKWRHGKRPRVISLRSPTQKNNAKREGKSSNK